eukprot:TRINITY_DN7867_c0_g1_i1.p1 TRINITY_DN7867_c0_g1~~TRINITY_DN7867_c0_g1_i1.p1  ORF type:complete len:300 (+),score=78.87 TRINITY_DN7867_c0_g1_i1:1386-2285(+)
MKQSESLPLNSVEKQRQFKKVKLIHNKEAQTSTSTSLSSFNEDKGQVQSDSSVQKDLDPGLKAAKEGDIVALKALVESGWSASSTDRHGSNALHWAAGAGHINILSYLIEELETDPSVRTKRASAARNDGKTPLHWAARNGQLSSIEYLVSKGTPVDIKMKDNSTPLHLACFGGHLKAVVLLVSLGADLFHKNDWKCSCAHWVAMGGSVEVAEWLLSNGMRFDECQKEGQTPLHKAAGKRHVELYRWLLSLYRGLEDPNSLLMMKDTSGLTAHQLLLAQGCQVDLPASQELSDLHKVAT